MLRYRTGARTAIPSRTSRAVAVGAAAVLSASLVSVANAATQSSGTIDATTTTQSWQGKSYAASVAPDPELCPSVAADPDNTICDHYTLNVAVDPSDWTTHSGGAEVAVSWPDAADDFDLYVYKDGELVASSAAGGTTSEKAVISKASGTYEVRVLPWAVTDSGYAGAATFVATDSAGETLLRDGPAEYRGMRITGALPATEPQNVRRNGPGKAPVFKSGPVGRDAAEPTVGVDASGTAYYVAATFDGPGGLARTELLRSGDEGGTWSKVTPPIVPGQSLPITLDPYVYVEEDSGRVFNLDLYVAGAYLSFSDDKGATWQSNPLVRTATVNDHQTLFAGPPPAGFNRALLTDPKFQEILYYCVNEVSRSACARSFDGGRTFTEGATPAYPGVEPMEGGAFCGGLHGHVATDPGGRVFLPKGHCGKPYISVSNDAGTTWQRVKVSDTVDMPDNQSAVASDVAGNLYYVWYDSTYRLPFLATSTDHGLTWSKPLMIAPPGVREVQWPTVAAGADGRVAITFPGTTVADQGDKTRPWDYYVVTTTNALAADPQFYSNIANPATDPVHRGDCPGRCGNMLDFLDVVVSPAADSAVWATVVDTCTAKSACNTTRAQGFDESDSSDGVSNDMKGLYVKQVSGPDLGG